MPDKDMLLLDAVTGKPACRKEVSTLVDQSSIIGNSDATTPFRVNYPEVAGQLAGSGVAANDGKLDVELTGSAQMPAEKTRDDRALTPAGAAKLVGYIKPVASTGALNAAQLSADAIEVPMLSNFSCNGGTRGAPSFIVPVAGGGSCAIDLGNLPYYSVDNPPPGLGSGSIPAGTVVASGVTGCFRLPEPGLYRIEWVAYPSESIMYVYNAGYSAAHPSPCLNVYTVDLIGCNPSMAIPVESDDVSAGRFINGLGLIGQCSSMSITYNGSVISADYSLDINIIKV